MLFFMEEETVRSGHSEVRHSVKYGFCYGRTGRRQMYPPDAAWFLLSLAGRYAGFQQLLTAFRSLQRQQAVLIPISLTYLTTPHDSFTEI